MIEFVFISIALFALGPRISLIHIVWILIAGTMIEKIMQVTVLYHIHRISIGKYLPMFWFVCWSLLLILAYSLQLNIVWN